MNPDLDRRPRQKPGRWPFPGDSPLVRARKVAQMYRAALGAANRDMQRQCDDTAASFGETWVVPRVLTATDDGVLGPADAADFLGVTTARIRSLRAAGRLPGIQDGDGWLYRVSDLLALQTAPRRRNRLVADTGA